MPYAFYSMHLESCIIFLFVSDLDILIWPEHDFSFGVVYEEDY